MRGSPGPALPGAVVAAACAAVVLATASIGSRTSTVPSAAEAGEPFYGTFYLLPSEGDDIEEVIDRGVSLVEGWFKRPFAGGRIREVTEPFDWFQLFRVADSVRVNTPGWTMTVPRGGTLEGWEREEGDSIDVSIEWSGEAWVHTLEADDGTRVNRYRLLEDGERLLFAVTLTSDQLRAPLDFELVFERR